MRKLILLLFVLLVLVWSVNALEVQLISPQENVYSNTDQVTFRCNAIGIVSIVTLYTDVAGGWASTGNSCNQNNCTFIIDGFSEESTYNWNCWAFSSNPPDTAWAPVNYSFVFHLNNNPPGFNGTLEDKTWAKNTVLNSVWDLDNYFYDLDEDTLTYGVKGSDKIDVEISSGVVKLTPLIDWTGSEYINFSASDGKGGIIYSNNIVLTVSGDGGSPPPTFDCSGATVSWDKDTDKNIDLDNYCDPDAISYIILNYPEHIGVDLDDDEITFSPNSSWTGSETIEFNATKDGLSDTFTLTLDVDEPSTSSDEDDGSEEDEEFDEGETFSIESYSPTNENVNVGVDVLKKFKVTPSGDTVVKWYLDEKKVGEGEDYTFRSKEEGTYELKAEIGNNDDFVLWLVTVGESAGSSSLCGNGNIDSGENCMNCAKDVVCAEGEECVEGECVTELGKSFFSGLSGYAVKTKDFVVEKWKYSSIVGGVIVVLIVVGVVFAGKRRKKDVLYEFGREGFFGKVGKLFKGKKGYVTKKTDENKSVVEKQREVFVDKPFDNDKP